MASQKAVFPVGFESVKRTLKYRPSVSELNHTKQSCIGVNLDMQEHKLAEFYLAEGRRLAHMGNWTLSAEGFEHWSPELFAIHGLEPGSTPPSMPQYMALVHPNDRELAAQEIQTIFAEHCPFDFTKRIVRPDSSVRHVRYVGTPATSGGIFHGFVGMGMDVTEQVQWTQERQRREAYLAEAQRLSHTGSFGCKASSGEMVWSEETFRILGYDHTTTPAAEAILKRIHPEDKARVEAQIARAKSEGKDCDLEYRLLLADDSIKHVHVVAHAMKGQAGGFEFAGAVMDVTERKRAEEKIQERETELRQMLDLAPQQVAVFGSDLERLYANRFHLDYVGLGLDQWRQMSRGSLTHPDDLERGKACRDRALATGSASEVELRLRKHDGSYRWFLARYNPVHDDKGQTTHWYVAATDIEDRKRAEEKLQQENAALREEIDQTSMFEEIVGTSPALQTVLSRISKVAPTDSTVLITGETGTGKELVARAIHKRSQRSGRAFVSVNCAAIPRDLIASELFGHEKGAFTGAMQRRVGRFELAEGGTILLDEVGELLLETQVALLRVLQEREFERIGGSRPIHVDVRVIAATNRDLTAAVADGTFRQDLFYRLNVFPLDVPPLRERQEDIRMLVEYFIGRYARKAGKNIRTVDKNTLQMLQSYSWPGNIRELQNVIERSVIVCETQNFSVDENWLSRQPRDRRSGGNLYLSHKLAATEKEIIEEALRESQGRIFGPLGAATKLGIARSTLESKIQSLNIDKKRFKRQPGT